MGKTGEWTVTDKQVLTPGPKLPERQHAGWQVSKKTEDNKADLDAKREPEIKRANGEEDEKRKKKKKHKKDKKKKRDKKEKKYEKLGESDDSETERKKRKKKKDKFGSKERKKTDEQENGAEDKFKNKKHKRKHKAGSDEGDEAVSKKKPCLVSYESSSNSDGEEITSSTNGTRRAAGIDSKRSSTVSMGRNIVEEVECILKKMQLFRIDPVPHKARSLIAELTLVHAWYITNASSNLDNNRSCRSQGRNLVSCQALFIIEERNIR